MRKGRIEKSSCLWDNPPTPIWERISFGKNNCWVHVHAYLNRHTMNSYSCTVDLDNYRGYRLQHNFKTIEEALEWGDSQVDYPNNKLIEIKYDD